MSDYEIVLDKTISSSGGSETSSTFDLFLYDTMSLKIEGDANSSDLDIALETKHFQGGSFGEYDIASSQDLTADTNDSKTIPYDVSDVNDARVVVTNNAGSSTDVVVKVGKTRGVQR